MFTHLLIPSTVDEARRAEQLDQAERARRGVPDAPSRGPRRAPGGLAAVRLALASLPLSPPR